MFQQLRVNKDSLVIGNFPMRKLAIIEIEITDDLIEEPMKMNIPFYRSSGTNAGKIEGEWYPILGIYKYDREDELHKGVKYFIENSNKPNPIPDHWLIKSPFFDNFEGYKMKDDFIPNGYGNHAFTEKLQKISNIIKDLYEENHYAFSNKLHAGMNLLINDQKYIEELIQYMCVGRLFD